MNLSNSPSLRKRKTVSSKITGKVTQTFIQTSEIAGLNFDGKLSKWNYSCYKGKTILVLIYMKYMYLNQRVTKMKELKLTGLLTLLTCIVKIRLITKTLTVSVFDSNSESNIFYYLR